MLSVMNNECELNRKSDVAVDLTLYGVEHPDVIRDSEATDAEHRSVARIDGTKCLMTTAAGFKDSRVIPDVGGQMEDKVETKNSDGRTVSSVAEHVEPEKVGLVEASVPAEINSREPERMDSRVSVQDAIMEPATTSGGVIPEVSFGETSRDSEAAVKGFGSDFESLFSEVDVNYETARVLKYGFRIGDMVWGKVKSHPMWPGQIFNEAFASPSVRRTKREGHVLVAFFGDSSYGWFDPEDLVPFEPHFAEKSHQSNSRNFLKAVEEAVDEASRRNALGLACYCRNSFNFRPTSVQGYFSVDVNNYEPGGLYSVKQIKMARDNFQPAAMLSSIRQIALSPRSGEQRGIDWIKGKATILAYRKAVYEEYDDTYAEAFGVQPIRPARDSMGMIVQPEKFPSRAPLSGPLVFAESLGERKGSTKPMKGKDLSKKGKYLSKKGKDQSKKGKDQSKKDKYLLKRREGPNDAKAFHFGEGCASISVPSSFKEVEAVPSLADGDYVLQKRVSMKPHVPGKGGPEIFGGTVSEPSQGGSGQEVAEMDKKLVITNFNSVDSQVNTNQGSELAGCHLLSQPAAIGDPPVAQGGLECGMPYLDEEICPLQEVKERVNADVVGGPISGGVHGSDAMGVSEYPGAVHQAFQQEEESMVDRKHDEHVKVGLEQPRMRIPMPLETHQRLDIVQEGGTGIVQEGGTGISCLPSDVKHPAGKVRKLGNDKDTKVKKVPKRPGEVQNSEEYIMGEKKKKKKRKEMSSEAGEEQDSGKYIMGERKRKKKKKEVVLDAYPNHQQKDLETVKDGEFLMRKSAGISIGIDMEPQGKVDASKSIFSSASLMTPPVDMGNVDVDLPELVEDLYSLALDPFHAVERNSPATVRQFLLQYRSSVYQKSLVLPSSTEAEPEVVPEASDQLKKFPAVTGAVQVPPTNEGIAVTGAEQVPPTNEGIATTSAVQIPPTNEGISLSVSGPTKKLVRPKDPTKAGRKRTSSERQEEISAKRLKKLKELKAKTTEKKVGNSKISKMQQDEKDAKGTDVAVQARPVKPDSVKKSEPSLRGPEPTMLVMKFPPKTTLPSIAQLKARFVRFGPLDPSAIRVLWKSSTCRVVFKHKSHAHAAHNYAVRNSSSLFGGKVSYYLRDLEAPTQVSSDSVKQGADGADETTQLRVQSTTMSARDPRQVAAAHGPRPPQSAVQLKSCLKKPTGDESGPIVSVPKESQRVKFMLGGEESSRGEQLMVSSNVNNNGSNADGGASSVAMDFNSKNFQKVLPLPPPFPLPSQSNRNVHESHTVQLPNYHKVHHSQVETWNIPNYAISATTTSATTTSIDISHEMLNLLKWCSEIVSSVKSSYGYVPYYPL